MEFSTFGVCVCGLCAPDSIEDDDNQHSTTTTSASAPVSPDQGSCLALPRLRNISNKYAREREREGEKESYKSDFFFPDHHPEINSLFRKRDDGLHTGIDLFLLHLHLFFLSFIAFSHNSGIPPIERKRSPGARTGTKEDHTHPPPGGPIFFSSTRCWFQKSKLYPSPWYRDKGGQNMYKEKKSNSA